VSTLDREAVEVFPPGSLGEPAVFAGIRERASRRGAAPGRPRTAIHFGAHAERDFGELRVPAILRVAGKLAHVFQYALECASSAVICMDPLTEFLSDGISLLETDLLEISDNRQGECR